MSRAINESLRQHASNNALLLTLHSDSISTTAQVLLKFDESTTLLASVDTTVEFDALGVFARPLSRDRIDVHGKIVDYRSGQRKLIYQGPAILCTHSSTQHVLFGQQQPSQQRQQQQLQHVLYICPHYNNCWPFYVVSYQNNQQVFDAVHGFMTLPRLADVRKFATQETGATSTSSSNTSASSTSSSSSSTSSASGIDAQK